MRKTSIALALLGSLAAFAPVVHAATSFSQASGLVITSVTANSITVNLDGFTASGFQFSNLTNAVGPFTGSLTSVSVNATLDASSGYTYADDLAIYVVNGPLAAGGLLQIGGYSDTGASERHAWANGGSSAPGTTVIDTVALTTPISFAGGVSDPTIWLGNGYAGGSSAVGTWSGSITLTFAPVPEPSSMALMALGGLGLAGWVGRRRRAANS